MMYIVAVTVSGTLDDLQEKRNVLQKVNSMGFTVSQQRFHSVLSQIREESCSLPLDEEFIPKSTLIESGA